MPGGKLVLFTFDGFAADQPMIEDVTHDGVVNDADLNLLLSAFGTTAFDIDGDPDADAVETDDVEALLAVMGVQSGVGEITSANVTGPAGWSWGSVRYNSAAGEVFLDNVTIPGGLAAAVPEPGSLVLLLLGALGLLPGLRRRGK